MDGREIQRAREKLAELRQALDRDPWALRLEQLEALTQRVGYRAKRAGGSPVSFRGKFPEGRSLPPFTVERGHGGGRTGRVKPRAARRALDTIEQVLDELEERLG